MLPWYPVTFADRHVNAAPFVTSVQPKSHSAVPLTYQVYATNRKLYRDFLITLTGSSKTAFSLSVENCVGSLSYKYNAVVVSKRRATYNVCSNGVALPFWGISVKSTHRMVIPVMVSSKKSSTVCVEGIGRFSNGLQCSTEYCPCSVLFN